MTSAGHQRELQWGVSTQKFYFHNIKYRHPVFQSAAIVCYIIQKIMKNYSADIYPLLPNQFTERFLLGY